MKRKDKNDHGSFNRLLASIKDFIDHFEFEQAVHYIEEIWQTIDPVEDPDEAVQLSVAEARVRLFMDDRERMRSALLTAQARVRVCFNQHVKAESLLGLSEVFVACHDFKEAERCLEQALEISRYQALGLVEINGLKKLARLNRKCYQLDAALFLIERAIELSGKTDLLIDSTLLVEKSQILRARGDLFGAFEIIRLVERQARTKKDDEHLILILLQESDLFRVAGDIGSAYRLLDDARKLPTFESGLHSPEVIDTVGRILLATEDYDEAMNWYQKSQETVYDTRFFAKLPNVFLGYAQCWTGMQNYTKALEYLWQADDFIFGRYVDRWDVTIAMLRLLVRILPHIQYSEYAHSVKSVLSQLETPSDPIAGLRLLDKDRAELNRQIAEVVKTVRTNKVSVFTRKGVRVDLNSGEVFHDSDSAFSVLSPIQILIFKELVARSPLPVSNTKIVGSYEKNVAALEGVPRRAHYFISELRKKLGSRTIILTKRGSGYYIPD